MRRVRYVDSRTGGAAPPVFTEHVMAGEDTNGWRHGFSADALNVDEFADSHPEVIVTRDLSRGTTTMLPPFPGRGGRRRRPTLRRPWLARDGGRRGRVLVSARRDPVG